LNEEIDARLKKTAALETIKFPIAKTYPLRGMDWFPFVIQFDDTRQALQLGRR
jgi:hypothetical protein